MREILFRGKREDGRGWAEGGIVQRSNGQVFIAPVCWASQIVIKAVDPTTVGQYTGLTDRNGKRIFEGDIIKARQVFCGELLCRGTVEYQNLRWEVPEDDFIVEESSCIEYEVIGNIHDTPELMNSEGTTRNGG